VTVQETVLFTFLNCYNS